MLTTQEQQLVSGLLERIKRLEKRLSIQETIEIAGTGDLAQSIHGAASKTTPVGADELALVDSAAGNVLKKLTVTDLDTYLNTLYLVLAGQSGGQTASGGTAANDDLTLQGTASSTRTSSYVFVQPNGGLAMIGSSIAPLQLLHVHRTTNGARNAFAITNDGTGNAQAGFRAGLDPTNDAVTYIAMDIFGAGRSTLGLIEALGTIIESNSDGNMLISSLSATKPMIFITGASRTERMRITAAGLIGLGGVTPASAAVAVRAGTSINDAAVGGVLYVDSSTNANGTTVETDLASYSVPANTLAVNNQALEFEAWITLTNNANTKTIKFKWGATVVTLPTGTGAAFTLRVRGYVVRTGATTQDIFLSQTLTGGSTTSVETFTTAAETLSGAVTLKFTGQSNTASNDVKQEFMSVKWQDSNL